MIIKYTKPIKSYVHILSKFSSMNKFRQFNFNIYHSMLCYSTLCKIVKCQVSNCTIALLTPPPYFPHFFAGSCFQRLEPPPPYFSEGEILLFLKSLYNRFSFDIRFRKWNRMRLNRSADHFLQSSI